MIYLLSKNLYRRSLRVILIIALSFLQIYPQQKPAPADKKNPEVTFEMMRKIAQEIAIRVQTAKEKGNALTELDAARALNEEYSDKGEAAQKAVATWILTLASVVGDYREALHYADVAEEKPKEDISVADSLKGYQPHDAFKELVRAAAANQVVMINEAHHVPQHRAFAIELLKRLRSKGFTYFAAETFSDKDPELIKRGYPTKDTGFYTAEPVFGDLVRTAIKLGFRIIPYEWTGEYTPDNREQGEAKNLFERTLKNDPKAKIIVYAGYDHINEKGNIGGALTMAQRFKEITGINPLTIDQTEMREHDASEYENSLYRFVTAQGLISKPAVFVNKQGQIWTFKAGVHDVTVFHPRSLYENGRPNWLRLNGSRKSYLLSKNICGDIDRCFVTARIESEIKEAIPVDQIEVVKGNQQSALMLPKGRFLIIIQTPEGTTIKTFQVKRG